MVVFDSKGAIYYSKFFGEIFRWLYWRYQVESFIELAVIGE